jgi:hypothetical protein
MKLPVHVFGRVQPSSPHRFLFADLGSFGCYLRDDFVNLTFAVWMAHLQDFRPTQM